MNLLVTGAWQGAKDGIEQLKMLGLSGTILAI